MTMRGRHKYLLAGTGATLFILSSAFAVRFAGATDSLDPAKVIQVSKADAGADLASFAGAAAADLVVGDPVDGPASRFYVVDGKSITGTIDAHDGHVITLLYLGIAGGSDINASADDALATARAYLDQHGVRYDGMDESVELVSHGDTNEYVASWERVVDGIIVPDARQVGVDAATGQVFRYANFSRAYQVPGKPTIDEASAIKLAVEASGLGAQATVDRIQLRIGFDTVGTQYLAWQVTITGPAEDAPEGSPLAHAFVEVNADSGVATIVGRG